MSRCNAELVDGELEGRCPFGVTPARIIERLGGQADGGGPRRWSGRGGHRGDQSRRQLRRRRWRVQLLRRERRAIGNISQRSSDGFVAAGRPPKRRWKTSFGGCPRCPVRRGGQPGMSRCTAVWCLTTRSPGKLPGHGANMLRLELFQWSLIGV